MRDRIRFLLIYFAFWAIYFLVARIVFLAYHIEDSKLLTLETVFQIFWNGFRMDLSMTGYLCLFPFLWVSFSNFIKKSIFQSTIFSYTFVSVFLITLIIVIDLEVYNIWNFRFDITPLNYLKTSKSTWVSIKSSPILPLILSFILLIIVSSYIVYRILANKIDNWKFIKNFPFLLYGILLALLLIIPIRGGFKIASINHSTVYFSKNNFANIAAINAPWNFFSSVLNQNSNKVNPFTFLPKESLEKTLNNLYNTEGKRNYVLNYQNPKPNLMVIVLNNFTQKIVDRKFEGLEITPNFNKLKEEGIYFSNFYASSDQTDKAISSILSGYPAQPYESVIKYTQKTANLPVISKTLEQNGYTNKFFSGGDLNLHNIKSYLFNAHFDNIYDKNNFDESLLNEDFMVNNSDLFEKVIEIHQGNNSKPFFSTILTSSMKETFEITADTKFNSNTAEGKYYNTVNLSDNSLGIFFEHAKKQKWWNNTLIIVLGDHGNKLPGTIKKTDDFKIPMIWTGGVVNKNSIYKKIASQNDLAASILGQFKINSSDFMWSKDLFVVDTKPWAHFVYNEGFGLIKPKKEYLFNISSKKTNFSIGEIRKIEINEGKALLQKSYQDFIDR
jgi:phosphoglycerol transferase MdoB-like AlkP superfamily enzyme